MLWPDCDPEAGRNRLSVALTSLRRQFEPPDVPPGAVIVADHATVRIDPRAVVSDVFRFESALEAAALAGSLAERTQWWTEAVTLYRGELLPGFFEDWIFRERERLRDAFLRAVGELTFLLTDIESSTAEWERQGEEFAGVLARHRALLREQFARHDGHEIKELGDGFLVAFQRAGGATRFSGDAGECGDAGRTVRAAGRAAAGAGAGSGAPGGTHSRADGGRGARRVAGAPGGGARELPRGPAVGDRAGRRGAGAAARRRARPVLERAWLPGGGAGAAGRAPREPFGGWQRTRGPTPRLRSLSGGAREGVERRRDPRLEPGGLHRRPRAVRGEPADPARHRRPPRERRLPQQPGERRRFPHTGASPDYGQAKALFEECLAIWRDMEDQRGVAYGVAGLARLALDRQDLPAARRHYVESLSLRRELGDRQGMAESLEGVAAALTRLGDPPRAARLFGAAESLRERLGARRPPAEQEAWERDVALLRKNLEDSVLRSSWDEGRRLTPEAAADLAAQQA